MKKRQTYLFSEEFIALIAKLKEDMHYNSATAVLIEAVNTLNRKLNPNYVSQRAAPGKKTPEQRAEEQEKIIEIRKKREEDKLLEIMNRLGGRLKTEGGNKQVEYFTYDKKNRYLQEMPLTMMSEELVKDQYFPSREDVEARQKKGEVNYDPTNWEA